MTPQELKPSPTVIPSRSPISLASPDPTTTINPLPNSFVEEPPDLLAAFDPLEQREIENSLNDFFQNKTTNYQKLTYIKQRWAVVGFPECDDHDSFRLHEIEGLYWKPIPENRTETEKRNEIRWKGSIRVGCVRFREFLVPTPEHHCKKSILYDVWVDCRNASIEKVKRSIKPISMKVLPKPFGYRGDQLEAEHFSAPTIQEIEYVLSRIKKE